MSIRQIPTRTDRRAEMEERDLAFTRAVTALKPVVRTYQYRSLAHYFEVQGILYGNHPEKDTQVKMAQRHGITEAHMSRIVLGKMAPSYGLAVAISNEKSIALDGFQTVSEQWVPKKKAKKRR